MNRWKLSYNAVSRTASQKFLAQNINAQLENIGKHKHCKAILVNERDQTCKSKYKYKYKFMHRNVSRNTKLIKIQKGKSRYL